MSLTVTHETLEKIRTGEKKEAASSLLDLLRQKDLFKEQAYDGMITGTRYHRFTSNKKDLLAIAVFRQTNNINFFCYADIRNDAEGWGFIFDRHDYINPKVERDRRRVKMNFYNTAEIDLKKWKESYQFVS